MRKIYDAYLDKVMNDAKNQNIEIDIWFAKIGYQESRKLLPMGFLNFLENIFHKVERYDSEKKYENFKDFLEVFLAYHKYFNPSAK
ncbi:MAG: type III-A CRISPR-associated protein Csm2 [Patescibacteria group bacterium]|nr:type III-A CRISPR-associated protein Csm2 [Patescibacteria group bacterium]